MILKMIRVIEQIVTPKTLSTVANIKIRANWGIRLNVRDVQHKEDHTLKFNLMNW